MLDVRGGSAWRREATMSALGAEAEAARLVPTLGARFERGFALLRFLGFAEAVFCAATIFLSAEINSPFVLSRL